MNLMATSMSGVFSNVSLSPPPGPEVSLLLHFDANFNDSSAYNNTLLLQKSDVSATNAAISTVSQKFGAGSALFTFGPSISSGWLKIVPTNTRFDLLSTDDYTIDFWAKSASNKVYGTTMFRLQWTTPGSEGALSIGITETTGLVSVTASNIGTETSGGGNALSSATNVFPYNTWNHIAVTRRLGVVRLFVNGVVAATNSGSNTEFQRTRLGCSAVYIGTGYLNGSNRFETLRGNMDEVRFVKGVAVWTSNFTPPVAPY